MSYVIPYNEQYTKPSIILKYQIKESHNCLEKHKMSYPRPEHQNTESRVLHSRSQGPVWRRHNLWGFVVLQMELNEIQILYQTYFPRASLLCSYCIFSTRLSVGLTFVRISAFGPTNILNLQRYCNNFRRKNHHLIQSQRTRKERTKKYLKASLTF
jgi:hypothetical protein